MNCTCGGALKVATIEGYDFSPFVGIPVRVLTAPGLRCDRCHGETFAGPIVEEIRNAVVEAILKEPRPLLSREARFLRKWLGFTIPEFVAMLDVPGAAELVGAWETDEHPLPIGWLYDMFVRARVLREFIARHPHFGEKDAGAFVRALRPAQNPLTHDPLIEISIVR